MVQSGSRFRFDELSVSFPTLEEPRRIDAMKTIGLLGGMSWESSAEYYRIINQETQRRLGGVSSAKSVMVSVDFAEIETMQAAGDWGGATKKMIHAAKQLEAGGADVLVICTNTMHRMAEEVVAAISIPLLHIADATADAIDRAGVTTVALLGTRYTMEQNFYRGKLEDRGLTVMVPDEPDRSVVHDIIYDELVKGVINPDSRRIYLETIEHLVETGAEGVIGGCTEIEMLVTQDDLSVPFFPTAELHALAAVDWSLNA